MIELPKSKIDWKEMIRKVNYMNQKEKQTKADKLITEPPGIYWSVVEGTITPDEAKLRMEEMKQRLIEQNKYFQYHKTFMEIEQKIKNSEELLKLDYNV